MGLVLIGWVKPKVNELDLLNGLGPTHSLPPSIFFFFRFVIGFIPYFQPHLRLSPPPFLPPPPFVFLYPKKNKNIFP